MTQNAPNSLPLASTFATDTPLPTPTDAASPTPTEIPTVTEAATSLLPPIIDEILSLAQDYINNQSVYAGSYVMVGESAVQIQSQDDAQLTACIEFDLALVAAPATVSGADMCLYAESSQQWRVVGDRGRWLRFMQP